MPGGLSGLQPRVYLRERQAAQPSRGSAGKDGRNRVHTEPLSLSLSTELVYRQSIACLVSKSRNAQKRQRNSKTMQRDRSPSYPERIVIVRRFQPLTAYPRSLCKTARESTSETGAPDLSEVAPGSPRPRRLCSRLLDAEAQRLLWGNCPHGLLRPGRRRKRRFRGHVPRSPLL